jgi:predicted nucleic acid-binding protein
MNATPFYCVVDASVGIKLFIEEEYSSLVQALFEQLSVDAPDSLFVPDLFFIECANIFWKKVQRGEYRAARAHQDLANLSALELPALPSSELMPRAFQLAIAYTITACDACYLAAAEALALPLVTADARLVEKCKGGKIVVRGIWEIAEEIEK